MKTLVASTPPREAELRSAFWDQVGSFPEGDKIKKCLQCGTCTGTCPVSYAMDLTPREVIGLFRAGHMEEVLASRSIWLCASCYSCTVRCPSGIRVTDTMYAFKRIAMERGIRPRRFPVHVLSDTFVGNLRRYGRNFELGLAIRYYLNSNIVKLFTDLSFALGMIRRGRIQMFPRRIRRIREVRSIIARASQFAEG